MSELKQVKASAGSGKTYQLTRRFLSLLDGCGRDQHRFACAGRGPGGYSWPEILAVTFTNKAAAEMKERVVTSLKEGALNKGDRTREKGHDPRRDERNLQSILRRYHKLNIRTIDSLLNLLLRLFALEFGIRPDFDISFDEQELFGTAFEQFIALCEEGGPEHDLLADALETMILAESRRGFWLMEPMRERLLELAVYLRENAAPVVTDQDTLLEKLTHANAALKRHVAAMQGYIKQNALPASANFTKCLAKLDGLALFDPPGKDSAMLLKESLCDCINKAGKESVGPDGETLYEALKRGWREYKRQQATLAGAYGLAPVVEMARIILAMLDDIERRRGVVLGSTLAGHVNRLLENPVVPEAFCRMGCRLHHLLIDEFQDTSRSQWQALQPIGEECLAKGGSLFYVGDVKQAIYGWRGGDADLFDEILHIPELSETAQTKTGESLPDNWRSHRHVVEFNNRFFQRFEEDEPPLDLGKELFKSPPDGFIDDFARQLRSDFSDCAQGVAPVNRNTEGYVRFEQIEGGRNEEIEEATLSRLSKLMDELLARRDFRDIAILVRNKHHGSLVCDLLVEKGVPVITESSLRLDRHPIVRQITALLRFLDYPRDELALAEFITGQEIFLAETGIGAEAVYEWITRSRKRPFGVCFSEDFDDVWTLYVKPFFNKSGVMTPYDLVQDIASVFRIEERHPDALLYLKRFLEVVHLAEEKGYGSLSTFLDFWARNSEEEKVPLPENVDAVRIMTIHKSKGLEFPVVIVPFHHWQATPNKDYAVRTVDGLRVLAPLKESLGKPYYTELGRAVREQLNLLYVAWTRAREELYGLYPKSVSGSGAYPALRAMELLLEDTGSAVNEYGTRPTGTRTLPEARQDTPMPDLPPRTEPPELLAWLPRMRVYRHTLDEYFYNERMRGEVAHRCMEHLAFTGNDAEDIRRARERALRDFPALSSLEDKDREQLHADLLAMLEWAASEPRLRTWLGGGRSEPEIMDTDGAFHRVDHLYTDDGETVVVEFKTGRKYDEHEKQVRRYLNLLKDMPGTPDRLHGVVVYLDLRELREVAL
ncbi:UvrD-helicase domain-containing protein [Salidesulfovibrio onnuriiensis]|uniref:UvrD-helicase domain-containing protein n=1 Tax=Salidesulfovibrio onnuriiensis TaxID=2583823 RepID=UPI0011C820F5|nr:UvrD-helicase domain-containing protein [Salidesulfovibrio onnuriiensis]